jgi:hypothetical protein
MISIQLVMAYTQQPSGSEYNNQTGNSAAGLTKSGVRPKNSIQRKTNRSLDRQPKYIIVPKAIGTATWKVNEQVTDMSTKSF